MKESTPQYFENENCAQEGGVFLPPELHIEVPLDAPHKVRIMAQAYDVATALALGADARVTPARGEESRD